MVPKKVAAFVRKDAATLVLPNQGVIAVGVEVVPVLEDMARRGEIVLKQLRPKSDA
jgi:hypothetical protein